VAPIADRTLAVSLYVRSERDTLPRALSHRLPGVLPPGEASLERPVSREVPSLRRRGRHDEQKRKHHAGADPEDQAEEQSGEPESHVRRIGRSCRLRLASGSSSCHCRTPYRGRSGHIQSRPDYQRISQLTAPAEGVARVGRCEAGPFALVVSPQLVADRKVVPPRKPQHRVVKYAVRLPPTNCVLGPAGSL
jgi:hypothetical protein